MKKTRARFILCCTLLLAAGCGTHRLEKALAPEHKEFLSQARYTILGAERKAFLSLPASERDAFIEDFWKRRDPNPKTEVNEFKDRYFRWIAEANQLFSAEGAPGWLQDRGRIYILLGPPDSRDTYPQGRSLYDKPSEVWYYGFFQIIFRDNSWTGDYILDPQSAMHIALINEAQMQEKMRVPGFTDKTPQFEFTLRLNRTPDDGILVLVSIPYKNIALTSEGRALKTTLKLFLEVRAAEEKDQEKQKTWAEERAFPLHFERADWPSKYGQDYVIEIATPRLDKGSYGLSIKIVNEADGSQGFRQDMISL